MKYTEKQLQRMASPLSQSEEEKCKNAIYMIRDALKKINYSENDKGVYLSDTDTYSYALNLYENYSGEKIKLLVQGSYANNTNVKKESDVDVAVILESTFIPKYRNGVNNSNYGFIDSKYSVDKLKNDVEYALKQHFGNIGIERHDKCIKVKGNTYRVDADVVPAIRYRDYSNDYLYDINNYEEGIVIKADSGEKIINYPEYHIKMGKKKNIATNYNFKKCVRIIKNMKEDMKNQGIYISPLVSSFGLESLLWNVDTSSYTVYSSIIRYTFDEIIDFLQVDHSNYNSYTEVNGIKKLFTDTEKLDAYYRFVDELSNYYEYDVKEE